MKPIKYDLNENSSQNIEEGKWSKVDLIYDIFNDADAVLILTEWKEYALINWEEVSKRMRKPAWLFDSRSIINNKNIKNLNLNFWQIGDGLG